MGYSVLVTQILLALSIGSRTVSWRRGLCEMRISEAELAKNLRIKWQTWRIWRECGASSQFPGRLLTVNSH